MKETKEPFWLGTAKRIEALARAGLEYTSSIYDRERYEELQHIGNSMFHEYTGTPVEKIPDLFEGEYAYPTPKSDIRAVIVREESILLIQEKMDNRWALPGGFADIGYSPKEVAVKEVQEEAGLNVKAVRLLAVFDKKFHDHPPSPFHIYKFFIQCSENGGEPKPGPETLDAAFFPVDQLPPLSVERNTAEQIVTMFKLCKENSPQVLCD